MKRKEYIQPIAKIILITTQHQLLSSSVTNIATNGFDEGDELTFGGEGIIWDNAW